MSSGTTPADDTSEAVFTAALGLLGILIAVIGIFAAEIGSLEEKGLGYLAAQQKLLLNASTILFCVCGWSAFFSSLSLVGVSIPRWLFVAPMCLGVLAVTIGVPLWVWAL